MSSTVESIASFEASLRMSMISALPPGRKTRCISPNAATGLLKFLNAARQTMKSNVSSANGSAAASPWRNSASTAARAACSVAMRTNDRLMSTPVIR